MKEYNFLATPIVDIVNAIIIDAVKMNASDIHFDPAEKYLKIRIRVDGELSDYSIVDNKYKRNLITRVKLLSGMNITESRLPQDGAIKGSIGGKDLDLRVSCLPTIFGEKVVVRILDYSMSLKGIESLGFTKENYELILKMIANPNGIVLVTGATGSGKSTTTYAMLQRLNSEETNIITVEDPVEMNIEGVNQVQVNSEIGLDFANVLRSILRQDPNIILIGEIRDTETAKIAIRSSITGHLVLSTLHTNNSLTSIERLLDMDVERYLLSASLKGIVSQNLAKKLCPKCKVKRATTETEKKVFKKVLNKDVNEIYEHGNCPECRNGYKGRIAIQEVLLINDEIRDAINENIERPKLRELIYKKDVKTLFQDGLLKVIEGTTSIDEIFKIIDAEDDISNMYGKDIEAKKNEVVIEPEVLELKPANSSIVSMGETPVEIISNKPIIEKKYNNIFDNVRANEEKQNDMPKTVNYPNITSAENIITDKNTLVNDDLESTQDIFASLWKKEEPEVKENDYVTMKEINPISESKQTTIKNNVNENYTNDLLNLINKGLFDEK